MASNYLDKMGSSWFVSYAYHNKIDTNHTNWENVKTIDNRKSWFNSSRENHKIWLSEILNKSDVLLERNRLGLTAREVKTMARELLKQM